MNSEKTFSISTSDSKVQLTIGILINKLNRDSLAVLIRKFKRYLKRELNAEEIDFLEVNTFLFINGQFPLHIAETQEKRKTVINKVESILQNYCKTEGRNYAKMIQDNIEIQDITKMILQLLQKSNTTNIKELSEKIRLTADDIDDKVVQAVSDVLLNSFIAVWDFPKNTPDVIIFPDLILKREVQDKTKNVPLSVITENLMILQFGKSCVRNLESILQINIKAITSLKEYFFNEENKQYIEENISDKLWRTLRVVFGLLSSTQQVISVQLKQIKRISEVMHDLKKQVEPLDYQPLMDYIMFLDNTISCDKYITKLKKLQKNVKETYKELLKFINKYRDLPDKKIGDVRDIVLIFIQSLFAIQLLKFFSDKFKDLAYFETIPTSVQHEDEEEIEVSPEILLKGIALFKTYRLLGSTVYALRGVDLDIKRGEMVAIVGPSGSGKTTLLNLLSGLDTPTRGAVFLSGKNIDIMSDAKLSIFRRKEMGFIFQYYNLIPQLTVLENVMLPGLMINRPSGEVKKRAVELIKLVGLDRFQNQFPIKLSGGQMQRVTIARAMINNPSVIFADEPTGDLDSQTGKVVIDLIKQFSTEKGTSVILVTHDMEMAKICNRIIHLSDGKITKN